MILRSRRFWIVVLVILVIGSWFAFRPAKVPAASLEETATASLGPLVEVITATGKVVPRTRVDITCKASGTVIRVPVQPGSQVKKGDLLLELDPQAEARTHQRAQVAVASAKARLEQHRLTLAYETLSVQVAAKKAKAALTSATITAQGSNEQASRLAALLAKRLAAAEEMENAKREQAVAEANLVAATLELDILAAQERQLEIRRQDVTLAEASLQEEELNLVDAEQRLADTRVIAPLDGTVTEVSVEAGQIIASAISTVGAGTPVMRIVDLAKLQVQVRVPEGDIGRIQPGQKANVGTDAFPGKRFPGVVQRIAIQGNGDQGQVTTFEVLVELEGNDLPLRPEMSAVVDLTTLDLTDALTVPCMAITRVNGRTTVKFKTSDGKTEDRAVVLGGSDGTLQQILSGLVKGDTVILPAKGSSRWRSDLHMEL